MVQQLQMSMWWWFYKLETCCRRNSYNTWECNITRLWAWQDIAPPRLPLWMTCLIGATGYWNILRKTVPWRARERSVEMQKATIGAKSHCCQKDQMARFCACILSSALYSMSDRKEKRKLQYSNILFTKH
jgi:hypothetical protein